MPKSNAGVTGNKLADMFARINADVIALAPRWCNVLGGANDLLGGRSVAQILADQASILNALVAAGIKPIVPLMVPNSNVDATQAQRLRDVNTWMRANLVATWPTAKLVDWSAALSTGGDDAAPGVGILADGTHFTSAGASAAAVPLSAVLATIVN